MKICKPAMVGLSGTGSLHTGHEPRCQPRGIRILRILSAACVTAGLAGCAGRAPQPVAVVQPQDRYLDCPEIAAEVQANNQRVQELASEEGAKVAQNVAVGVAGLFIWPLWFGMDFQGSAGKEAAALQNRQQYLATLAEQKRCGVEAIKGGSAPTPAAYAPPPVSAAPPPHPPVPTTSAAAANMLTNPPPPSLPIAGSMPEGRVVQFPVTVYNSYHPYWTLGVGR